MGFRASGGYSFVFTTGMFSSLKGAATFGSSSSRGIFTPNSASGNTQKINICALCAGSNDKNELISVVNEFAYCHAMSVVSYNRSD